ncbi:MAG: hypothetical protein ABI646_03125 [Acidobacteriota bacterium]
MKTILTNTIVLISFVLLGLSCGPNQRILESANENQVNSGEPVVPNPNSAPAASSFEQDLNAMRTADFKFIVVFRRKDGKALDAADKGLVSKAGSQANRRRLSDEEKAVIIGSNFPFMFGEFDVLSKRFKMENYSKPDSGPMFSNATPGPSIER